MRARPECALKTAKSDIDECNVNFLSLPTYQWLNGGQNLVPAVAASETPDAIESEVENTMHDFIRGVGGHRNSYAL